MMKLSSAPRRAVAGLLAAVALFLVCFSSATTANAQYYGTTYINGRPYGATNFFGWVDGGFGHIYQYIGTGFRPNYVGYTNLHFSSPATATSALYGGGGGFAYTSTGGGCFYPPTCNHNYSYGLILLTGQELSDLFALLYDNKDPWNPANEAPDITTYPVDPAWANECPSCPTND